MSDQNQPETHIVDRSDEPSAFAWIMSGTLVSLAAAGLAKAMLDRRRQRAIAAAEAVEETPDGHPS
jgi:hypothetical protein